jgi:hypothetical protein
LGECQPEMTNPEVSGSTLALRQDEASPSPRCSLPRRTKTGSLATRDQSFRFPMFPTLSLRTPSGPQRGHPVGRGAALSAHAVRGAPVRSQRPGHHGADGNWVATEATGIHRTGSALDGRIELGTGGLPTRPDATGKPARSRKAGVVGSNPSVGSSRTSCKWTGSGQNSARAAGVRRRPCRGIRAVLRMTASFALKQRPTVPLSHERHCDRPQAALAAAGART